MCMARVDCETVGIAVAVVDFYTDARGVDCEIVGMALVGCVFVGIAVEDFYTDAGEVKCANVGMALVDCEIVGMAVVVYMDAGEVDTRTGDMGAEEGDGRATVELPGRAGGEGQSLILQRADLLDARWHGSFPPETWRKASPPDHDVCPAVALSICSAPLASPP